MLERLARKRVGRGLRRVQCFKISRQAGYGLFVPFAPHHHTVQTGYFVMSDVRDKPVPVMAAPRRHSDAEHRVRRESFGCTQPRQSVHIGCAYVPRKVLATTLPSPLWRIAGVIRP